MAVDDKRILRKRNGKLAPVYEWAVAYSRNRAKERKAKAVAKTPLKAPHGKR